MNQALANHFAQDWLDAWNAHDLDRVLSHYTEDFEMHSPLIVQIAGLPEGRLQGKQAIAAYWAKALSLAPNLKFKLHATYLGADSVALHYEGVRGPAIEVFFFNEAGLVIRAAAHYV
jgi:ketosteroid isomerase-like protein